VRLNPAFTGSGFDSGTTHKPKPKRVFQTTKLECTYDFNRVHAPDAKSVTFGNTVFGLKTVKNIDPCCLFLTEARFLAEDVPGNNTAIIHKGGFSHEQTLAKKAIARSARSTD
jgi:hypothetical protein